MSQPSTQALRELIATWEKRTDRWIDLHKQPGTGSAFSMCAQELKALLPTLESALGELGKAKELLHAYFQQMRDDTSPKHLVDSCVSCTRMENEVRDFLGIPQREVRVESAPASPAALGERQALAFGDGDYSCVTCGMGMKEPCKHWVEFLAHQPTEIHEPAPAAPNERLRGLAELVREYRKEAKERGLDDSIARVYVQVANDIESALAAHDPQQAHQAERLKWRPWEPDEDAPQEPNESLRGLAEQLSRLDGIIYDRYLVPHREDEVQLFLPLFAAHEAQQAERIAQRPHIVCLCGSTRFTVEMLEKSWELAKQGIIGIGWNALPEGSAALPNGAESHGAEALGIKEQIDELHKRKIDLADEVFVLNIGGYIGESTRSEIEYAERTGKPVRYLEAAQGTSRAIRPAPEKGAVE